METHLPNGELPFISALLVTRNESEYIERSLWSLINQTYPKEKYEIIVIDGFSDDGTREKIESIIEQCKSVIDIKFLDNPKKILSSGWNIGIQTAKGEYVVRIDAHAEASPTYLQNSVDTFFCGIDAVCVGGKLITKSLNGSNDIVSKILSSPFGVGNSSFRVFDTPCYVDTVVYGLYRKSIFGELGHFNESYVRNQDVEFHSRIKKKDYKFFFNPDITCTYYARNTVKKMLKMAFQNGKWNMVLMRHDRHALSTRHLIPFIFVLFLLSLLVSGNCFKEAWYLLGGILCLHLILGFIFASRKTGSLAEMCYMPILFFGLHIAYGCGYFAGIFVDVPKLRKDSLQIILEGVRRA